MPTILTDENFETEIRNSEKPVLVDFFATWCGPCSILTPILEKIAASIERKLVFGKVDLDNIPLTAQKYGIDRVPTVVLFKNGNPVSGFVGLRPEEAITEWLKNMLKDDENASSPSLSSQGSDLNEVTQEEIDKLTKEYVAYALKSGIKLNPNKEIVGRTMKGLLANEKKYGKRYCPCRRVTGNPEKDMENICPCRNHHEDLEKNGSCFCGLFTK